MSRNKKPPETTIPWKEIIGLLGVVLTAYIGYLGIRSQNEIPIRATQTAEARLTEFARSATLPSTNTPPFTPPVPLGYEVLDQFEGQDPLENNWKITYSLEDACSAQKQDGFLYMSCNASKASKRGNYALEYGFTDKEMRSSSDSDFFGIAMSAKMLAPDQNSKAKVYFIIYFKGADATESIRAYSMPMRFDNVEVVESYPLESWRGIDLARISIDSRELHIIETEYKSGQLAFYVDGQLVQLQDKPNLPSGAVWQDWTFGVEINNWEDQPARLEALIDWIAVSTTAIN